MKNTPMLTFAFILVIATSSAYAMGNRAQRSSDQSNSPQTVSDTSVNQAIDPTAVQNQGAADSRPSGQNYNPTPSSDAPAAADTSATQTEMYNNNNSPRP